MARIAVVGAGVSGLTCGVVLAEHGHAVTIWAAEIEETTSSVAAAIWWPYDVPLEQAVPWGLSSYDTFRDLAGDPASGVVMIDFHVYSDEEEPLPSWSGGMDGRRLEPHELPSVYAHGFRLTVPLVQTPIYLPYLRQRLAHADGRICRRFINAFSELASEHDLVVNCTGLQARELCDDEVLEGGRGVIVVVDNPGIEHAAVYDGPRGLTYVIPRRDDCVLGGVNDAETTTAVAPELERAIYERCRAMDPALPPLTTLKSPLVHKVGFRPRRNATGRWKDGVRLERESIDGLPVIHNYGHGGAGFTVAWGCAFEVLSHVREALSTPR